MKNFLKRFEENDTHFFVMKSYLYPIFEVDRKKEEFHIFFIKNNSSPDAYFEGYKDLKVRRMNKLEVKYFKANYENYKREMSNEDGVVFNFKTKPFDKKLCPTYRQYVLNL